LIYDAQGFSLFFHFAPNPYFSNQVLKKYYQLEIGLPAIGGDENPFNYDGPTILRCVGYIAKFVYPITYNIVHLSCEIDWSPGKNVTVKIIKKAPKKGPNAGKPMTKTVSIL
jgi:nucleosome assembly protein 1-like 1